MQRFLAPYRELHVVLRQLGLLYQVSVLTLKLVEGYFFVDENTFSLLHAIVVEDLITSAIGPAVKAFAVLLAVLPLTLELLSVGVEKNAFAEAVVVFKFSVVHFPVWPQIRSFACFTPALEVSIIQTTIWPLE